ncbi:TPA: helix-turn-helix domain-containing protein [Flavobacterium psychrophilum]
MSLQLYSHSKHDLEKVVEIILNKAQNFQLYKTAENETAKEDLISQAEACVFLKISLPTIINWRTREQNPLPHYNFNGRFFYSQSELLAFGKSNNQKNI